MEDQETPRTIGKYKIVGTLGRGSMGMVYRAEDPEIGRTVAIKTIRKLPVSPVLDTVGMLDRFKVEARSAGNLRHPHIITIFEVNSEGDMPYLVMDYIEGEGLDVIIAEHKRLEPEKALQYLRQIASGLDHAHSKGIVHRDIKPSNILVDRSDTAFILDFGVARLSDSAKASSGPVMGSPGYMSPEQIKNEDLDHRSDLFSFGVLAFECFTGKRPFPGNDFATVVGNILSGKRHSVQEFAPHLPLSLESDFVKAFSKDRESRFRTAADMVHAFARSLRLDDLTRTKSGPGTGDGNKDFLPVARTPNERSNVGQSGGFRTVRGSSINDRSDFGSGGREGANYHSTKIRPATVVLGILCISLGVAIFAIVRSGSSSTDVNNGATGGIPGSSSNQPAQGGHEVEAVEGLSNQEVLNVIGSAASSEASVLRAIREAEARKLVGLVDVAATPLGSDSYAIRVEILKALGELGDKNMVPDIIVRLDDHDPVVRMAAAGALAKLGDRRALGYLTQRMVSEENEQVKSVIKQAVETINGFPFPSE